MDVHKSFYVYFTSVSKGLKRNGVDSKSIYVVTVHISLYVGKATAH
jgi:hypothetical protein